MELCNRLDISPKSVVAVIGCGGKTSLIELLAKALRDKKVLVSPTTKMFPMQLPGIDCIGVLDEKTGKLAALPEGELSALVPRYDVALLEADGSKSFFAKGWRGNEPVVPPFCTHTVGVVTLKTLGRAATSGEVHCLPEFLELTGLREGEIITPQALIAMVCEPGGMFKNSSGRRYLLVNQIEDADAARAAYDYLSAIKQRYPGRFERLLYGSVHYNDWQEV